MSVRALLLAADATPEEDAHALAVALFADETVAAVQAEDIPTHPGAARFFAERAAEQQAANQASEQAPAEDS